MSKKEKSLDELLEESTDERTKMKKFQDTDFSRLSSVDFAHARADVFRECKRIGRQQRLVREVEQADAEAEAAKRRAAERRSFGDYEVTQVK